MAVDSVHTMYDEKRATWRRLRDAWEGSAIVRKRGETYLPKPAGMDDNQFDDYLNRPEWFAATRRTVQGLRGAVFRKPPVVQGVHALEPVLADITGTGVTVEAFARLAVQEVLLMGRYGVLVDMDVQPGERVFWSGYTTERILNWRTERIGASHQLTLVVLEETLEVPADDGFATDERTQYRVLKLEEGAYVVEVWEEQHTRTLSGTQRTLNLVDRQEPRRRGERLTFVPFVFLSPSDLETTVEESPLFDLVNINYRYWRHAADLEHGRHLTAVPTLVITGHNPHHDRPIDGQMPTDELVLGSSAGILLPEPEAKVFMLEFTGQGLQALSDAIIEDKTDMATLGARLLEDRPDVQETATAVRLRQSGDESILRTLVGAISAGLTKALQWSAWWMGFVADIEDEKVSLALNDQFLSMRMTPQEIQALVAAWQVGSISHETLYAEFVKGEIGEPGIEFDEELARIEASPPAMMRLNLGEEPAENGEESEEEDDNV